jgi:DNA-binding NtrC family response regulator
MEAGIRPEVLVIDDDHAVADTLAMVLNISGFNATPTYSGERAVELAGKNRFDHLVTDVVMDGMNGIEAALAIRALLPECHILLMSGNNNTSELLAVASAQGNTFNILAKPVHPSVMLEQLRSQGSQRAATDPSGYE